MTGRSRSVLATGRSRLAGGAGAFGGVGGLAGLVGLVGLAGLAVLVPATGASAHDYVLSSSPEQGAVVTTELGEASVTFSDVVLDLSGTGSSNVLEVTDASGRHFEDGCSATAGPVLSTGVALGAAGEYTMTYQAVSADGHTVSDSRSFSYQPPAGVEASAGAAERPVCDPSTSDPTDDPAVSGPDGDEPDAAATTDPAAGADATVAPETGSAAETTDQSSDAADDGDGDGLGLAIGLGVGIVVLALVAVVVVIATSRRRSGSDEGGDEGPDGDGEADGPADGRSTPRS